MSTTSSHYKRVLEFARGMRKNPTKAEQEFWSQARRKNLFGLKINRQFLIRYRRGENKLAYYIADFYCHQLKLVIEIDGEIHKSQIELDLIRTENLNSLGFNVLSFTNEEVLNDFESVEMKIGNFCTNYLESNQLNKQI